MNKKATPGLSATTPKPSCNERETKQLAWTVKCQAPALETQHLSEENRKPAIVIHPEKRNVKASKRASSVNQQKSKAPVSRSISEAGLGHAMWMIPNAR